MITDFDNNNNLIVSVDYIISVTWYFYIELKNNDYFSLLRIMIIF